ncbi:MAG: hypothetical protein IM638_06890 [Bacteroidetes bacterium]|nr:hypothetical protein [Bacteroidota bacterium]
MCKPAFAFIAVWLLLFAGKISAQHERLFFHSAGVSILSGIVAPPAQNIQSVISIYQRPVQGGDPVFLRTETVNRLYSDMGLIIFSATYNLRWNYLEPNKNSAFSLSTAPTLGVTSFYLLGRLGHFSLPLLADFNFGYKATRYSEKNYGWHLGVGWEFLGAGLVKTKTDNTLISDYGSQFWTMPVFRAGFRAKHYFVDFYFSTIRIQRTPGGFLTEADLAGEFQLSQYEKNEDGEPQFVPLGLAGNGTYEDIFERRKGMQEMAYSSYSFKIVFGLYIHNGRATRKLEKEHNARQRIDNYAFR